MNTNYEQLKDYCKNEGYSYYDVLDTIREESTRKRLFMFKLFISTVFEALSKKDESNGVHKNAASARCNCC